MLSKISSETMSATTKIGSETEVAAIPSARVGEPRVSRSVTAGMSDAEFEAWLSAQGALPMSEERRRSLNLDGSGAL